MKHSYYIFLGPPGVGKGTQGKILAEGRDYLHLSTGDLLRSEVEAGSELGLKIKDVMSSGQLVSDQLIVDVMRECFSKEDQSAGFILDGFPRTVAQAEAFEEMLTSRGEEITAVLSFNLSDDEVLARLTNRREAENRDDDTVAIQEERLRVYKEQTAPLIEFYEQKNLLKDIDSSGAVDLVAERVKQAVAQ